MARLALLVAALALAACGGDDEQVATPEGAADVEELANVLDLRADFEDDAGKSRMIVLLSPT